MCTVLLPPGVNPTAVKYIIYHLLHYHEPNLCLGTVLKQQLKRIRQWHISALLSPADHQFHAPQYAVMLSTCLLENWVRIKVYH
jgi:hypothetical protein